MIGGWSQRFLRHNGTHTLHHMASQPDLMSSYSVALPHLKTKKLLITSCTRPRVAVAQSHPVPSLSHRIPSCPIPYIKSRAYSNTTLCQNLKAIGEELSEIVAGSTASSPDIDFLYIYINTRVFECNVVSKFQTNQWRTFGDCCRLHRFLHRYRCTIYIYI
jgi:hypothetical protein